MERTLEISRSELNLESIIKYGGQGPRIEILDSSDTHKLFRGIFCNRVWHLRQRDDQNLFYEVLGRFSSGINEEEDEQVLRDYLQLDVNLAELYTKWSENEIFKDTFDANRQKLEGIRVLKQNPFQVFIRSFITRNITQHRANANIESLCQLYGETIEITSDVGSQTFYNFPTLEQLTNNLDTMHADLKSSGFGLSATSFVNVLPLLERLGGEEFFESLRDNSHRTARQTLRKIKQVGSYVSEFTCAFGLAQQDAVITISPIFNIISRLYMPNLPRHRINGNMNHYEKHLRAFFRRKFPENPSWAVSFWLAASLLNDEKRQHII